MREQRIAHEPTFHRGACSGHQLSKAEKPDEHDRSRTVAITWCAESRVAAEAAVEPRAAA
jgi:hypothetical protein